MQHAPSKKINIVAALKGSPYEEVAARLAEEFEKVGITEVLQVSNAPLKLKVTFGVDVYAVMKLITDHADSVPQPKPKKSS